jgi:hypothetical protein
MLVFATGGTLGIARKSNPSLYTWGDQDCHILDALDQIEAEWRARPPADPSIADLGVLSMSFGVNTNDRVFQTAFADRLKRLITLGILPVCSAGNNGAPVSNIDICNHPEKS